MNQDRKKYLKVFLIFFVILSIFQVLDFLFTFYVISIEGTHVEANPFMRFLFETNVWLVILVKIFVMLFWFIPAYLWVVHPINFYKKWDKTLFLLVPSIITSVYFAVVLSQIVQILVYLLWLN